MFASFELLQVKGWLFSITKAYDGTINLQDLRFLLPYHQELSGEQEM